MSESLVLIDFVNDIVHADGAVAKFGTPKHAIEQNAVGNAANVLACARKREVKIIHVRVGFKEGYPELEGVKAPFYVAHRENNWLRLGTWGTEFVEGLEPEPGEIVVTKSRINPFTSSGFEAALVDVERLVVAGVATNLAVEETVRNASAKGFEVVVLEDCCASNNAEIHEFSVTQIIPKFAIVSCSSEYIG